MYIPKFSLPVARDDGRRSPRPFSHPLGALTALALLGLIPAHHVHAQEVQTSIQIQGGDNLPDNVKAQLQESAEKMGRRMTAMMGSHTARLTPGLVAADPGTGIATLELTNTSDDTLPVRLSASLDPMKPIEGAKVTAMNVDSLKAKGLVVASPSAPAGNPLLVDDSASEKTPTAAIPVRTSVDKDHSLVGWIKDLPAQVTLKPHEKKSIPVHIVKPANATAGKYAAWIIAVTDLKEIDAGKFEISGDAIKLKSDGTTKVPVTKGMLQSSAKVELLVGQ